MSILQMFAAVNRGLPYIDQFTTLPQVNTSTYINVGSVTLDANGDYLILYAMRITGELGVADHRIRIDAASDSAGGSAWGHTMMPVNSTGFPMGSGPFKYTMIGDGSLTALLHSSSSGSGRTAGLAGSLMVQVAGSPISFRFLVRDHTGAAQTVKLAAAIRKMN